MKRKTRQLLEKLGIIAWLVNHKFMAGPKVVRGYNEIVATFTSVTEELKELRTRKFNEIKNNSAEIARLTKLNSEANSEADKATNAAANIERLFQPPAAPIAAPQS